MNPDQRERYVRWQDYRMKQLSYAINLFLSFAVASLGFAINLKLESSVHSSIPLIKVIIWWASSASFGCVATISKLLDYRYTARKIKDGGCFNAFMAKWFGEITWWTFAFQVIGYSVGAYCFIRGVINA
ncbi:MAG TPA: hypothetical protein VIE69_09915 [Methylophilaceae bacterium]